MWLLAIDRSSPGAGAALFKNGELIGETCKNSDPARSPQWVSQVADLLQESGITAHDLSAMCAGLGPGSFSGIRSSLAALQGLSLPNATPQFGVSSIAALAYQLLTTSVAAKITIIGDARRERFWGATFCLDTQGYLALFNNGEITPPCHTSADFILSPVAALSTAIPDNTTIVTPDYNRIGAILQQKFSPSRLLNSPHYPDAAAIARLYLSAPTAAISPPLPIYLSPAVAAKP
ncbi:MAG: tRNA (adenosine(37)-N6)-threonylcarbamoyltransferase complex dimerization subunit type 1 TsaB [Lentisphaerae bacterium]|jgi:tRNA threonylcarbamoyl adenosine modification protein YeaZ|nr:tRNA (adenosine(37)-N6)-threonylcarbamoyltransferase complex dimerization subunit type 1 TsaB [Lentisphaerota bacterium]